MFKNTFRWHETDEPRKIPVKFYLTPKESEFLDVTSKRLHLPKTELIRIAIGEYFDNHHVSHNSTNKS